MILSCLNLVDDASAGSARRVMMTEDPGKWVTPEVSRADRLEDQAVPQKVGCLAAKLPDAQGTSELHSTRAINCLRQKDRYLEPLAGSYDLYKQII